MNARLAIEVPHPTIIELENPPKPLLRPHVVFPLVIAGAFFLFVLFPVFFSNPLAVRIARFLSTNPIAGGLIFGIVTIPFVLGAQKVLRKKAKLRRKALAEKGRVLSIEDRIHMLLNDETMPAYGRELEVASVLAADQVVNVILLFGRARELPRLPIDVPFEPLALDESAPTFYSMLSLQRPETKPKSGGLFDVSRAWRRRIRLGSGLLVLTVFGINALIFAVQSIYAGRATPELIMWTGFLVMSFLGIGGLGAWRSTDQWFLVPGGIVRRFAKPRSSQWNLHLFTRSQGFLLITESRRRNRQVCVADAQESATATVTVAEAELLLRAWLSPLPAPSVEQLADLA